MILITTSFSWHMQGQLSSTPTVELTENPTCWFFRSRAMVAVRKMGHNREDADLAFRRMVTGVSGFLGLIVVVLIILKIHPNISASKTSIFMDPNEIPNDVIQLLDAVLVLGGGVPSSLYEPPLYVQRRCDDAAVVAKRKQKIAEIKRKKRERNRILPILCLSAGTAHLPQLMSADGLPVWESTSSAAYLSKKHGIESVYVETTSYDTIGNAFYARTGHTDVAGWKRLLIITNEFHMARTRAIFDWVYGVDSRGIELYYLSSPNVGLSEEAIAARKEREAKSLVSVRSLAATHRSLNSVWGFLHQKHSLYTAKELVARGEKTLTQDQTDNLVKKSYGAR